MGNEETYYHYTSCENFKNILSSGELWLSSYENLKNNECIIECIKTIENFLRKNPTLEAQSNLYADQIIKPNNFFIASFCLRPNNRFLWSSRYGNFGKGVAIGFSGNDLYNNFGNSKSKTPSILGWNVEYDNNFEEKCLRKLRQLKKTTPSQILGSILGNPYTPKINKKFEHNKSLIIDLWISAQKQKETSYSKEEEFRIINYPQKFGGPNADLSYIDSNKKAVLPMRLNNTNHLRVNEIIVTNECELSSAELRKLVNDYDQKIKISYLNQQLTPR